MTSSAYNLFSQYRSAGLEHRKAILLHELATPISEVWACARAFTLTRPLQTHTLPAQLNLWIKGLNVSAYALCDAYKQLKNGLDADGLSRLRDHMIERIDRVEACTRVLQRASLDTLPGLPAGFDQLLDALPEKTTYLKDVLRALIE